MHELTATDVGVSVMAVVVILKVVFEFVDKQRSKKDGTGRGFTQTDRNLLYETNRQVSEVHEDRDKVKDLHSWHDRDDVDGIKVWYVRSSLEKSVVKLGDAIEHLVRTQETQLAAFQRMCDEMRKQRRAPTEDGL